MIVTGVGSHNDVVVCEELRKRMNLHKEAAVRFTILIDALSVNSAIKIDILKQHANSIFNQDDYHALFADIDYALKPVAEKWIKRVYDDVGMDVARKD